MADRVATYRLGSRRVEVWRGDALEIPASLALFGRDAAMRSRLEAIAGRGFETIGESTRQTRRIDLLAMPASPWRFAASVDYHPRRSRLDPKPPRGRPSHVDRLSFELCRAVVLALSHGARPDAIAMLPLSCRNPEVVAVATALAVWRWFREWMPRGSFWGRSCRFRLVDLDDPGPYIHALEDRDAIVTRALGAGGPDDLLELWQRHRFSPA